jgi:hypothetical protein
MAFVDRIRECNAHDLAHFRPFIVAGQRVGWVRHPFADMLAAFDDVFDVVREAVRLSDRYGDFEQRSAALDRVVRTLESRKVIKGRRDEYYPVSTSFAAQPLARIERAAIPPFGIRAYGVHMNGYVRKADGLHMWIGRRAKGKHTYPGMLDNTVAGGQPMGIGLLDNLVKECKEEAAIPEALARRAVPVGAITYCMEAEDGLKPDVQGRSTRSRRSSATRRNSSSTATWLSSISWSATARSRRTTRTISRSCAGCGPSPACRSP